MPRLTCSQVTNKLLLACALTFGFMLVELVGGYLANRYVPHERCTFQSVHVTVYVCICTYRWIFESAYHYPVHNRLGALPGTYLHHLWMHARLYDCNKSTWLLCVRWFFPIDCWCSGRRDVADPMLSPCKVRRSRPPVRLIISKRTIPLEEWKLSFESQEQILCIEYNIVSTLAHNGPQTSMQN